MNSRIGLLGGTFDPIHNGHLSIAKAAIKQLKLDNLLLIPAGNPWQKEEITEIQHRIAMTKLAFTGFSNVEVSD
jgi:nicotinate-nucleotide adenylyltransferase